MQELTETVAEALAERTADMPVGFFHCFPLKQLNCLKAIFVFFWTVFFLDGFFNLPFSPAFVDELM